MSFEQFMTEQIAAIEESGLEPDAWIELHAEEFRASHPVDEPANV
jgi:hypothetical protein